MKRKKLIIRNEDQRISPRKILRTRVVFEDEFGEGFLYFLSTDISYSGIFIESNIPLQLNTKVLLRFALYEGEEPIRVPGEVTRHTEPKQSRGRPKKNTCMGIGIRFLGLTPEALKRIERFITS